MEQMKQRINRLQAIIKKNHVQALLVSKPENQYYLTGFHSSNCKLIISQEENYLLTDFRYIEAAGELSDLYTIVLLDDHRNVYSFVEELKLDNLALEESHLTVEHYKLFSKIEGTEFKDGSKMVEAVRIIKEEGELDSIRRAQEITDKGFTFMLDFLRPGISEKEGARELEAFLKKEGAEKLSFDMILISGVRTSLPHGGPSDKLIEKGDFVTLDFGVVIDGYCSDMTRTVSMGVPSDKQKEIYDLVLKAQKAGLDGLKEGLSCKAADALGRDIITEAGYGNFFGHGTGHGVGLEIHEAPTLNHKSEEVLMENMVVTVEPGIYLPGEFGVRIEDLAIIKPEGIINLTKSPKELIIL